MQGKCYAEKLNFGDNFLGQSGEQLLFPLSDMSYNTI